MNYRCYLYMLLYLLVVVCCSLLDSLTVVLCELLLAMIF